MVWNVIGEMSTFTQFILLGVLLLLIMKWIMNRQSTAKQPPGPFPLPLIGNLLPMWNTPFETLVERWKKKYGPVFTVYLGPMKTLILADYELINDALVKQGSTFSGRPYLYSLHVLTGGSKDIGSQSYGEFWKLQRKIAVQAIRQYLSGNQFEQRVYDVTRTVLVDMEKATGPVDLHMLLSHSVFNIFHGLCFGETYGPDDPVFKKVVQVYDDMQEKTASGYLEDFLPIFRYWNTRKFRQARESNDWVIDYIRKRIKKRRAEFNEGAMTCLADNIIQAEKESQEKAREDGLSLSDDNATLMVFDVFGGGLDTLRVSLEWIIVLLSIHPDIQARMQREIDRVVGQDMPNREHRSKLVYTEAIIFETIRLCPPAPYGMPHEAMTDTWIGNYFVPKKTMVFVSLLNGLRDPKYWDDPLTFKPERFLDETQTKIQMQGKNFIAFSMGHRSCPGEALAKLQLMYVLVNIFQKFSVSLPPGQSSHVETTIDGLTIKPPSHKVICKKRQHLSA